MHLSTYIKNHKFTVVCLVFSVIMFATPVNASLTIDTLPLTNHSDLQQLEAQTTSINGSWNTTYDLPKYLRLHADQTTWTSTDPLEKVYQFLDEHQQLYKLTNPRQQFKLHSSHQDEYGSLLTL